MEPAAEVEAEAEVIAVLAGATTVLSLSCVNDAVVSCVNDAVEEDVIEEDGAFTFAVTHRSPAQSVAHSSSSLLSPDGRGGREEEDEEGGGGEDEEEEEGGEEEEEEEEEAQRV